MSNALFQVPYPVNEPVKSYAPGSPERAEVKKVLSDLSKKQIDVPMFIGGKEVRTKKTKKMTSPHNHKHVLGTHAIGEAKHLKDAIAAALKAREKWAAMPWEHRAAIFLKAADLLAGPYRARMNAATMLAQSKSIYQAEIDAVCEMIDFLKFNVQYATEIYAEQPESNEGMWNRLEYRALEGFVFALTPFNFTSIAGNLPASAALMGNVVVWKPANSQIYSAHVMMELFREAGVPDGVINLVFVDGPTAGDIIFNHASFAGIHFTGSTGVFRHIWKTIGNNIAKYKSYPRIVGETGGKDFIMAHPSADADALVTAMTRGAFEFQGQKCSAASRAYVPKSLWKKVQKGLIADVKSIKMGDPADFTNFFNAVIDEKAFNKISSFINKANKSKDAEVIVGGKFDKKKGYYIEPTVIVAKDAKYVTMCEEIFGPVLTIFVYADKDFEKTLDLLDSTSEYALTGAIWAQDRYAIELASKKLVNAAGNFYINDKPTGAVVGQQPFGGARGSGTNDKAGSKLNLLRWVNARTIKETFNPPKDYRYPFMMEE